MNDRELLELAAKAAGVEGQYFESENGIHIHTGIYRPGLDYYWNPLISDSEALRLAVKLRIDLQFDGDGIWAKGTKIFVQSDLCQGDPMKAAREAIVSVAAEIGRSMP